MKLFSISRLVAVLGALAASTCGALAAVIVGTTPIAPPPEPLSTPGGVPWTITTVGANTKYTVGNSQNLQNYKVFWMEISWDSANDDPFQKGEEFNQALWPTLSASGSAIVIIGASYLAGDGVNVFPKAQLTATFTPQPEEEYFTTSCWTAYQASHIKKIEVRTQCIPEPGPLCMLGVTLLFASACGRRRK